MLKIAITGNIASGKTLVENILIEKGFSVLDSDIVAHNLLKKKNVKKQIIETFADFDIVEDSEISRKKLGEIIFKDKDLRTKLENILHPLIKDEIGRFFRQIKKQGEKIAFASVPLLFEAKLESIFDKIILVYADDTLRLKRLMDRNQLPLEYAQNRLKIQTSQDEKISLADYVLYNNKTPNNLRKNLEKILSLF